MTSQRPPKIVPIHICHPVGLGGEIFSLIGLILAWPAIIADKTCFLLFKISLCIYLLYYCRFIVYFFDAWNELFLDVIFYWIEHCAFICIIHHTISEWKFQISDHCATYLRLLWSLLFTVDFSIGLGWGCGRGCWGLNMIVSLNIKTNRPGGRNFLIDWTNSGMASYNSWHRHCGRIVCVFILCWNAERKWGLRKFQPWFFNPSKGIGLFNFLTWSCILHVFPQSMIARIIDLYKPPKKYYGHNDKLRVCLIVHIIWEGKNVWKKIPLSLEITQ